MERGQGMKVENGMVIGTVSTNRVGSECEFEICTIDRWNSLTEEEKEREAIEAMLESGMIEVCWE